MLGLQALAPGQAASALAGKERFKKGKTLGSSKECVMTVEVQRFPAGSPEHPGLPPVSGEKEERDGVACQPLPGCWNISMFCEVCTGKERVFWTELWVRLGMLLLPPGLANQRF